MADSAEPVAQTADVVAETAEPVAETADPIAEAADPVAETADTIAEPTDPAAEAEMAAAEDVATAPATEAEPDPAAEVAAQELPAAESPATAAPERVAGAAAESTTPAGVQSPQLLVASNEGLRVLQPSGEASEVPLRVETIGYGQGGVRLSGRGTGGPSDLRIYLDNDPVAVTPLSEEGDWQTELEGVEPGTYTLRVDQLGDDGKVTSRFETPFLRETEASLARSAPAQADPEALEISVITVQPGYSLWAIATDRYGDGMEYHKVLAANRDQIRDPDLIYPGQVFDLPE